MSTATATKVKETPLPLKAATAKAVHAGIKTQFRCAMSPQPPIEREAILERFPNQKGSPFGEVGDLLWVREPIHYVGSELVYAADGVAVDLNRVPKQTRITRIYTPSLLMPRWAHRLTLEITKIKVERVQNISLSDVLSEGFEFVPGQVANATRAPFVSEWDRLNKKYGYTWDRNPWCWVISFRKL